MNTTMIIIITVVLTVSIMTSLFLFLMLRKSKKEKEDLLEQQKNSSASSNDNQNTGAEHNNDPFFERFEIDFDYNRKLSMRSRKEGFKFRGKPYFLIDCPKDSIYAQELKWINDIASHNLKNIDEVIDRENATIVAKCNLAFSGKCGVKFSLEDIYDKIITEPSQFDLGIYGEIKDRLVIFEGYIENKKFYVKKIKRTKFSLIS